LLFVRSCKLQTQMRQGATCVVPRQLSLELVEAVRGLLWNTRL
jgi:hypothetical protein